MRARRRPAKANPLRGRRTGIALGVVALGLVAAFALSQAGAQGPAGRAADTISAQSAPDLSVSLLGGRSFELARERGHPVLVLFTASWCSPCIPEVNKMAHLDQEYAARGLRQVVVSIDPGDSPDDFALLRDRTRGQRLLWGLDPGQRGARAYRIIATDTKVLIDAGGRIAFTAVGPTDLGALRREVEQAFR